MKSSMLPPTDTENGFTLVEILVSLIIILIMVMAIVPMYEVIAKTINSNKTRQVATGLANSALEEMRTLPYIVKDPDTGQVVTDPDVPQLGIQGGNPPGSLVADQDIVVDGITYILHTKVYWVAEGSNPTAYKKVKVNVESPNAFKGNVTVTSDFYTLATEEGEAQVFESGHIAVHIRDKDGSILSSPDIYVRIESDAIAESNYTEDGELLFGIVPAGNYTVSAQLPSCMVTRPDQVLNGGWVEQEVSVSNWSTKYVYFDIDYPGKITVAFQHPDKTPITGNGEIELHWKYEENFSWSAVKGFKIKDFDTNNRLPDALFGNLWPGGYYSIKVNNLLDSNTMRIYNYDMDLDANKPKLGNGDDWHGTFEVSNTILDPNIVFSSNNSLMHSHLLVDVNSLEYYEEDGVTYITSLIDQSGNDNHANPKAAAQKDPPTLDEDPPMSINFSGGNNMQQITFDKEAPADNFTIFFLVKANRPIEFVTNGNEVPRSNANWLMYAEDNQLAISMGTNGIALCEHQNGNKYKQISKHESDFGNDFKVVAINCQNRIPYIYVNNSSPTLGIPPSKNPLYLSDCIGGGPKSANEAYFSGNIAEVMIYSSSLSDTNMNYIIDHLMNKYGLH